jgi:Holliday junction resolvase RusA-like endonuclease
MGSISKRRLRNEQKRKNIKKEWDIKMEMITLRGNPISTNMVYRRNKFVMYMSAVGKQRKIEYQWQAKTQYKGEILKGPVGIEINLFFKNNLRRDWDNWHKLTMDALTGIVWEDDSQITDVIVRKKIDKENPRIEIIIN